jgi:tRNA(Ser,Leu) C12 N-acetylase TAN1
LNWNEEALISANELKIIQVEMFGGEANISVIETYKLLMTINYRLMKFNDALKAA